MVDCGGRTVRALVSMITRFAGHFPYTSHTKNLVAGLLSLLFHAVPGSMILPVRPRMLCTVGAWFSPAWAGCRPWTAVPWVSRRLIQILTFPKGPLIFEAIYLILDLESIPNIWRLAFATDVPCILNVSWPMGNIFVKPREPMAECKLRMTLDPSKKSCCSGTCQLTDRFYIPLVFNGILEKIASPRCWENFIAIHRAIISLFSLCQDTSSLTMIAERFKRSQKF